MKTLRLMFVSMILFFSSINLLHSQQKYAVLIAPTALGDNIQSQSFVPFDEDAAFWNDTYLMWEMLVTKFGFSNENVIVLYSNGTDKSGIDSRYTFAHANSLMGWQLNHITDNAASSLYVKNTFEGFLNGTNGLPKINENDFLFVFTFGHGTITNIGNPPYHGALNLMDRLMQDNEFAGLVNSIPANKRVIWMQNCTGGDFADDLTFPGNYFMTSTKPYPNGVTARAADDCFLNNGTRICNYSLNQDFENELINSHPYMHGEFIFHLYSNLNGASPEGLLYYVQSGAGNYSNFDYNQDGYKTIQELYQYEFVTNSRETEFTNYIDQSNIGNYTSFDYPTLLHDNLTQSMTCRGLIGISNNTVVKAGTTLTIEANSKVHLLNGGNLVVEPNANLVIQNGVEFIKDFTTSTNKIEVNGTLSNCSYVTFNGGAGSALELVTNNVNSSFMFDHCTFINSAYKGVRGMVTVDNSTFAKSYCSIGDSVAQANLVYIRYNTFQANGITIYPAITINGMKKWVVIGNTINQYPSGVKIWNSGKASSPYMLSNNVITNCTGAGVTFYNSRSTVSYNTITGNYKGVESLNNSTLYVYGLCNATTVAQTQQISYNTTTQFESTGNFPVTFKHNAIEAINTTSIRVRAINCPANTTYTIEKNYWGNGITASQMAGVLSITPSTSHFDWDPIWLLGDDCSTGGGGISNTQLRAADSSFHAGLAFNDAGEYALAKSAFINIIYEYPTTEYAQSALYELFFLESMLGEKYDELKDLYENDAVILQDTALAKIAKFMAAQCNIELKNYSDAISWFESVIENPASFNDSIFAIIDLGYTYFLAENDTMKSSVAGHLTQYKPKSMPDFVEYRDYLLSLVNNEKSALQPKEHNFQPVKIKSIDPNPVGETLNIHVEVIEEGEIVVRLQNVIGQTVISKPIGYFEKGSHMATLGVSSLASGTYLVSVSINGVISNTSKLIKN